MWGTRLRAAGAVQSQVFPGQLALRHVGGMGHDISGIHLKKGSILTITMTPPFE